MACAKCKFYCCFRQTHQNEAFSPASNWFRISASTEKWPRQPRVQLKLVTHSEQRQSGDLPCHALSIAIGGILLRPRASELGGILCLASPEIMDSMDMEDVLGKEDTLCGVACCMGVVTSPE